MTDNKITREKTFSEELPYFKERIKEIFDNYDNPNGYEDPLYIAVLRDSKRVVRKAEEEINRQKAEYNNLLEQFRILDCECGRLEKADENQKAEIEQLKFEIAKLLPKGCPYAIQVEVSNKLEAQIKSEAIKEFAERLKAIASQGFWEADGYVGAEQIDNLVKEMVGDKE